ncbi:2-oxoglutarate and iron-dependent oxygenase domain-containing protein, partial [Phenylobacterium sp.]|uniref:2-oxoglutarate and iron-dependent oxygenase domain-containing protein n=1 Tax=Phenylobacterium sp. TaxID=1871053 RepID=UPI00286A05B9
MSQAQTLPDPIAPVSFTGFSRDFTGFTQALGGSFARYGFAVIADHAIPQDRIDAALAAARAFFALPEAVKLTYKLPVGGQRGFTPFGVETAKGETHPDLKEFWHVGRELPPGHPYRGHMADNVWPDAEVAEFHAAVGWLYDALDAMGLKLLEAIACYLGLDRRFFAPTVDFGNSILRLL